ncbi:MAG: DUF835 domain-containing protein, partial [Thaumarchaeota archaeon]|nr:DUF835 domain-containing protein [Nitrososphaerota archaeon]
MATASSLGFPLWQILLLLGLAITTSILFETTRIRFRRRHDIFFAYFVLSWVFWTVPVIIFRSTLPPDSAISLPSFAAPFHAVLGYHFALHFIGSKRSVLQNLVLLVGYVTAPFFIGVVLVSQSLIDIVAAGVPAGLFTIIGSSSLPFLFQTFFALLPVLAIFRHYRFQPSAVVKSQARYILVGFIVILASRTINSILGVEPAVNPILVPIGMTITLVGLKKNGCRTVTPVAETQSITPIKHAFKPSTSYLAIEDDSSPSFLTFSDLVHHGYYGLCITRIIPDTIRGAYQLETTPILLLINTSAEETIHPRDLAGLYSTVQGFLREKEQALVLLHGIEFLVSVNGFEPVLQLIRKLKNLVSQRRAILILT